MPIRNRWRSLAVLVAAMLSAIALLAGCGSNSGPGGAANAEPHAEFDPAAGAEDVSPVAPISVKAENGTLQNVVLTSPSGKAIAGKLSNDAKTWTVGEPLGYGAKYTWSGTVAGKDNKSTPIEGSFTTLTPDSTTSAQIQIADGQEVGIAAPIIVQFNAHVEDKAAVEKALKVTTDPPTTGSWAWLPDDRGSRVHWRPQNYWTPGTKVKLDAKLYGLSYGDGAYGETDATSNFTIGRSQIVKASAPSHRMQVVRDGETVFDFAVSYGEGNEARNVTRSGVHVVTEKHEDFLMSNPPFYTNVRERWAVRISNNGEFIHANPESVGAQGSSNVTNGCINLSPEDAAAYFPTALYGDPVEVTGTSIPLSASDGDLYDWTIDWDTWKSMSALADNPGATVSATPRTPAPAGGN
ncbi:L,D-transpeptidase [Nocardiaceae bacterium YC2-7]|uniref:L,D-transpeptidase n=2 Tax=Antrihabitans stalactiti TaxID=2584121 RepID=A0A848KLX6_9NOCA|nr:Ig-like domain-containing protein [Antrihabitans stalactiti]NMN97984.1 L,D-transpeptidase [Antrihabitans stalactiti]